MAIKSISADTYISIDMFTNNLLATLDRAVVLPSVNTELSNAHWYVDTNIFKSHPLYFLAWMDIRKCMHELGHTFRCDSKEGVLLFMLYLKTEHPDVYISYDNLDDLILTYGGESELLFNEVRPIIDIAKSSVFSVADILGRAGFPKIRKSYIFLLFQNSDRISKADDYISKEEELWKQRIMTIHGGIYDSLSPKVKPFNPLWHENEYESYYIEEEKKAMEAVSIDSVEPETSGDESEALSPSVPGNESLLSEVPDSKAVEVESTNASSVEDEVESLDPVETDNSLTEVEPADSEDMLYQFVGLEPFKETLNQILEKTKSVLSDVEYRRALIFLFSGNSGTGKKTIANVFTALCHNRALISSKEMLVYSKDDLIKSDWETTSKKLMSEFLKWSGHIVYLRNAPEIFSKDNGVIGTKALSFILNIVNTPAFCKKVILIFGGDNKSMDDLCIKNADLARYAVAKLRFKDYDAPNLIEIFEKTILNNGIHLTNQAKANVEHYISSVSKLHTRNFNNAQFVIDLADRALVAQAERASQMDICIGNVAFEMTIEDISVAISLTTNDKYVISNADNAYNDSQDISFIASFNEEPQVEHSKSDSDAEVVLEGKNVYLKKKNAKAKAVYNKRTGITVLAGSILQDECTASFNVEKRNALMEGNVEVQDGKIVLINNIHFRTPSGASDFVLGASTNGWTEWKTRKGNSLDDLYRKK